MIEKILEYVWVNGSIGVKRPKTNKFGVTTQAVSGVPNIGLSFPTMRLCFDAGHTEESRSAVRATLSLDLASGGEEMRDALIQQINKVEAAVVDAFIKSRDKQTVMKRHSDSDLRQLFMSSVRFHEGGEFEPTFRGSVNYRPFGDSFLYLDSNTTRIYNGQTALMHNVSSIPRHSSLNIMATPGYIHYCSPAKGEAKFGITWNVTNIQIVDEAIGAVCPFKPVTKEPEVPDPDLNSTEITNSQSVRAKIEYPPMSPPMSFFCGTISDTREYTTQPDHFYGNTTSPKAPVTEPTVMPRPVSPLTLEPTDESSQLKPCSARSKRDLGSVDEDQIEAKRVRRE